MVGDDQAGSLPEISAPAFVGREREAVALGRALSCPPAVVLVEGEPGSGKSRLVREYLAAGGPGSGRMLLAVCPPFREALTLGPVVDAFRRSHDDPARLPLSGLAGALRPLFPEWAEALPPLPPPLDDARTARHRLFRALAEMLTVVGMTGLMVEDAHWADGATLEFLLYLAASPAAGPSLVVTYRPEEVPAGSPLRKLSSRLPAGTTRVRIELAPLDSAATAAMAASMLDGGRVAPELAGFLHERTGGVPLAVEEAVRLLRDRAELVRRDGEWLRPGTHELGVSPTLRDSVQERVQRLAGPAQRVLRAAAVLGEAVDLELVTTVADLPPPAVDGAVDEAVGSGLLREEDRGRIAFRHTFLRQSVYETIPATDRQRLHKRAGLALEGRYPPAVAQLTRHFREADEVERWCRYAERAATQAVDSGDRTTATILLHDLLASAALPPPVLGRLTVRLADTAAARGTDVDDLHRQVVRTLRRLLDTGHLSTRARAQVRSRMGRLLALQGDLIAARTELIRAVPDLTHDPSRAARTMSYLGWPVFGLGPATEHLAWLERAAAFAPQVTSPVERLALAVDRATALLQLGEEAGWRVAADLPLDLPAGCGDSEERSHAARGALNVGYAALIWGWFGEARTRLEAGLKLADSDSHRRLHSKLLVAVAELDWLTGAWEGLDQRVAALLDAELVDPINRVLLPRLAGRLHAVAGAPRKAEACFDTALREVRQRGMFDLAVGPAAALAWLRLDEGQVEAALCVTEEPMATVTAKQVWVWATELAPARVAALVAAGRAREAAALVSGFARGLRGRQAPAPHAGLATCRAILAEAGGAAAAVVPYARAAQAWERLPRPYDALLARERQAHCLLAAGRPEAAVALFHEIRTGFAGLGASADADRVARALRRHGVAVREPWRGGRKGYGTDLSPREQEVVRLVLAGKTNREIAQVLCKSPRTVAGQVGSVMRKLGVSSRTELAVRVVETGAGPGLPVS